MCYANVLCPLCSHSTFENIDYLRISLINAANGPIACPQCNDIFIGLDKLTVHLFSHSNISDSHNLLKSNDEPEIAPDVRIEGININSKYGILAKRDLSEFPFPPNEILEMHKLKELNAISDQFVNIKKQSYATTNEVSKFYCNINTLNHQLKNNEAIEEKLCSNIQGINCTTMKYTQSQQASKFVNHSETLRQLIASTKDIKLNETGKLWECDICEKTFTTKYFLRKHNRLHTGEMPYSCKICGRTFTFQQSYHKHLLYHNDEKPHVCQTCNRAFKEVSTLRNHERIHSGEKPFKCEICGKCFRQRVSFLVHTRIHTGVMPYKCSDCQKSFRYKLSLRTHKCWPAKSDKLNSSAVALAVGFVNPEFDNNISIVDGKQNTCKTSDIFLSTSKDKTIERLIDTTAISNEPQNISECDATKLQYVSCPSVSFGNVHSNPQTNEEKDINGTLFSQFLDGIDSGYW